ncbi:hypothetical protein EMCRGX_G019656 [Ephydatia muelleri]|eukprot:Em0011g361a
MATKTEEVGQKILSALDSNKETIHSYTFAQETGEDHQLVIGAIKSLQSLGNVIQLEQNQFEKWELTEEGAEIVEKGSHEARVFNAVDAEKGSLQADLMKLPNAKIGFSKAMSAGWLSVDKNAEGGTRVLRKVPSVEDLVQQTLKGLSENGVDGIAEEQLKDFKKRKLITNVVIKYYNVRKGPEFSVQLCKLETDLTPEMIQSGSWETKKFKPYNFDALGVPVSCGHLHPLMKVRTEIRQIFLEMGFTEMPTNNFIESSFWNFDALFQPQQHPARDCHDTFFISDPMCTLQLPEDYMKRVKRVHENGGDTGSIGYQYDWKEEEARKNLLRTHTTAVSARMLYKLGLEKEFRPVKYFSIDRVFRNEALDATHLAEFHQIEGVVADRNITLGDLMGMLHGFFGKMGIKKLRFKPAYNPYTEPSMEVFSYHEGLKKWVEIGNSGVFRPELLLPMNLPKDVSVIAWGLSLERPTMIKYGIDNIRDLVGHKVDFEMVYSNPICRL